MKKFWMACALLGCAAPVFAEGFYVAGDVGRDRWSADSIDKTMTASVFSIAGGYTFDLPFKDTLSLELSYRDLGSLYERDQSKVNSLTTDLTAAQLSVIANHSFNESLSLYGRLGYAELQVKSKLDTPSFDSSSSSSQDKAFAGVGGRYAINQKIGVRVEYQRYQKLGDVTISLLLLGADYQF
jgi:opacity protein-like surface antigen